MAGTTILMPPLSCFCVMVVAVTVRAIISLSDFMAKATTQTGLKVVTTIIDAVYETGRKATKAGLVPPDGMIQPKCL